MTVSYRYALTPNGQDEPIVRWEYEHEPEDPGARWCRHHLQGPIDVDLGAGPIKLDTVHLPTGWVAIEELLRFCIVELGAPPLTDDWHAILAESYTKLKTEFAPMGDL